METMMEKMMKKNDGRKKYKVLEPYNNLFYRS